MDYWQEPAVSIHRRRRQQRAAITLTVVTLLLLATFVYAASFVQGWVGSTKSKTAAIAACHAATSAPLTPRGVTINVYNSTDRTGLAASVAKLLHRQGFEIATIGNDPLGMSIQGVAEIRMGPAGAAGASLLASRLPGATVVPDGRLDATVDVVLGYKFKALSAPPKGARPTLTKPTTSC